MILEEVLIIGIFRCRATHSNRASLGEVIVGVELRARTSDLRHFGRGWWLSTRADDRTGEIDSLRPGGNADSQRLANVRANGARPSPLERFRGPMRDYPCLIQRYVFG